MESRGFRQKLVKPVDPGRQVVDPLGQADEQPPCEREGNRVDHGPDDIAGHAPPTGPTPRGARWPIAARPSSSRPVLAPRPRGPAAPAAWSSAPRTSPRSRPSGCGRHARRTRVGVWRAPLSVRSLGHRLDDITGCHWVSGVVIDRAAVLTCPRPCHTNERELTRGLDTGSPGAGHDRRDAFGVADGALPARCRRCGKTGCGCAPPGEAQRDPVLSLTRKESGKTVTRIIPARAAEKSVGRGGRVSAAPALCRRSRSRPATR